jgi:hypothetical protein
MKEDAKERAMITQDARKPVRAESKPRSGSS